MHALKQKLQIRSICKDPREVGYAFCKALVLLVLLNKLWQYYLFKETYKSRVKYILNVSRDIHYIFNFGSMICQGFTGVPDIVLVLSEIFNK
jgi:hypothetical protein